MQAVRANPTPDGITLEEVAGVWRIKDLGVSSAKLAAGAVIAGKIGAGAIVDADVNAAAAVAASKVDLSALWVMLAPAALTSPAGAGAWEAWDLSAVIPAAAKFALIYVRQSVAQPNGVRANGSALDRRITSGLATADRVEIIPLDAGRIVERRVDGAAANAAFTCLGYMQ